MTRQPEICHISEWYWDECRRYNLSISSSLWLRGGSYKPAIFIYRISEGDNFDASWPTLTSKWLKPTVVRFKDQAKCLKIFI